MAAGYEGFFRADYYLDPPDRAGLLLGFASLTTAEIREAVALLVRCLEEAG